MFTHNSQEGSVVLLVVILSGLLMTQFFYVSKSLIVTEQSVHLNIMEKKAKYAALSGLPLVSSHYLRIPSLSIPVTKQNLYAHFDQSLQFNSLISAKIGLLRINGLIYSMGLIENGSRAIVEISYAISEDIKDQKKLDEKGGEDSRLDQYSIRIMGYRLL